MKLKTGLLTLILIVISNMQTFSQNPDFHIYLCFGQSNMAGSAKAELQDSVVNERFKVMMAMDCPDIDREMGKWYSAIPPLNDCNAGLSPADYFGRAMVENLPGNIKVGVVNVSIPGCKIELFDKENYQAYVETAPDWMLDWINGFGGNPYGRLVETAKLAQKEGVIKGILLHQGESNANDSLWTKKVKDVYDNLISDLNLDPENVPLLAGELVNYDQNGACAAFNENIAQLPEVIPNSYVVPSAGCKASSDRLHFTAEGYRLLGKRYAAKLLPVLGYSAPDVEWPKTGLTSIESPDGKLKVSVSDEGGKPLYNIMLNDKIFVENSPLGMKTNIGDYTSGMQLAKNVFVRNIRDSYELPNIKKSSVDYEATEGVFTFIKDNSPAFDLILRVSNNDVAFKYKIYAKSPRLSCVVDEELTGFVLPQGTKTFLCPQMKSMTGFARTAPSYETPYTPDDEMGKNGWGHGYTFPCLFKVNDTGWVLISETGVDSRYCASRLTGHPDGLYRITYPMPEENNGNGTSSPGISLPGETPWRTITVGETLKPIVETTLPFDVVKPKYEASKEYEYSRGSWSWIMKMDNNTTFPVQKEYIDFSAAMGYETILVDALWDTQIGREKIEELAKYGKSKNVNLYLWYNSNGFWNDAPQGPRNIMHNPISRRKEMAWMQSIGIRGIKVDFFGGDKQVTMKLYEDILYDANDFGLLAVFHGCTLPRGWERMFPNFASGEAVLASEMLHFSQERCDVEAFSACMHSFVRNTVGSMDFGGSALNEFYNANNTPNRGSERKTSDVFALATAVLFQSPVQHFALAPNNLTDAPEWSIDFMKEVPSTWDDLEFIDGYPGKYVILARRKAGKWYIAGINAQEETLKLNVKLPMIKGGQKIKMYSDDEDLNGIITTVKMKKNQEVEITIPKNGGVLMVH